MSYGFMYDRWCPTGGLYPWINRSDFYWAITSLKYPRFMYGIYDGYRFGFLAFVQYEEPHDCDNCPTCNRLNGK